MRASTVAGGAWCSRVSHSKGLARSTATQTMSLVFSSNRKLHPSGKNFVQTVRPTGRMALQMGKLEDGLYALDFRFPYAPIQAFATLLTTLDWLSPV